MGEDPPFSRKPRSRRSDAFFSVDFITSLWSVKKRLWVERLVPVVERISSLNAPGRERYPVSDGLRFWDYVVRVLGEWKWASTGTCQGRGREIIALPLALNNSVNLQGLGMAQRQVFQRRKGRQPKA